MSDDILVKMVAKDLLGNLEARAVHVRDVYGVCLWCDDHHGDFLIALATESWFERQSQLPPYDDRPEEMLRAPSGLRWSVGDWLQFPDDDFLTDETKASLEPLASRLNDDDLDLAVYEAEAERWRNIGFAALELVRPLEVLPTTDDAIAFVTCGDPCPPEDAETMLRTVTVDRFHEVFPVWRRLAQLVRSARANEALLAELRKKVDQAIHGDERFPGNSDDELTRHLQACGMWWWHVTTENDAMAHALRVGEAV